jgi:hypothetical protein
MDKDEPTLKSIAEELTTPGYLARARARSRASKTIWDVLFVPVAFVAMGAYWYAFTIAALWLHRLIYPASAAFASAKHSMTLAEALMGLPPFFAAMPFGFMTSNLVMWLVPLARRASEAKAKGVKWASYQESQRGLFRIALILVPLGLGLALIGALI